MHSLTIYNDVISNTYFSFFTGSHSLEAGESGLDDESQDIAGGTKAIIIYPNIFLLLLI